MQGEDERGEERVADEQETEDEEGSARAKKWAEQKGIKETLKCVSDFGWTKTCKTFLLKEQRETSERTVDSFGDSEMLKIDKRHSKRERESG